MRNTEVEVLAPAGSYESLKAAIASGADAVYLGGTMFGARAYATNFDTEELKKAIDYVHIHGKKLFLTVNTLLKDEEIKNGLYDYLSPLYEWGLDAVLVQDLGVLSFIRTYFPELPVHTSTQMTLNNVLSARFYKELGVERVVVSRELGLDEIQRIVQETGLEVECFVHGALCYCYSGQCLYSSMIGGRSGNRGQCAQPCRLPYEVEGVKGKKHYMSLKDVCTLEMISEMIEAGIYSFKIEGRMKRPEYVALVTSMYRKYTDLYLSRGKTGYKVDPEDIRKLMDLYNRGGFTEGYFHQHNGEDMLCLTRPNHAGVPVLRITSIEGRYAIGTALEELRPGDVLELPKDSGNYTLGDHYRKGEQVKLSLSNKHMVQEKMTLSRTKNQYLIDEVGDFLDQKKQEKINGKLILSTQKDATLELSYNGIFATVTGPKADVAKNQPLDEARIMKQMNKTGNSEFSFAHLEVILEGNIFYPMQQLNDLRHRGMEELEQVICNSYGRTLEKSYNSERCQAEQKRVETAFSASVEQPDQLKAVLHKDYIDRVYLDANILPKSYEALELKNMVQQIHKEGKEAFYAFPHVFRENAAQLFNTHYDRWKEAGFDGVLVRNVETYEFLKEHDYKKMIVLDHHVYTFNSYSQKFWMNQSVNETTCSLELNDKELRSMDLSHSEMVVYGYAPMMLSANCMMKTSKGCSHKTSYIRMKDRVQKEFMVKNCCDYCYNIVYNSSCLSLIDERDEIVKLGPGSLRLAFTVEDERTTVDVLEGIESAFLGDGSKRMPENDYTRGHFKRGIK